MGVRSVEVAENREKCVNVRLCSHLARQPPPPPLPLLVGRYRFFFLPRCALPRVLRGGGGGSVKERAAARDLGHGQPTSAARRWGRGGGVVFGAVLNFSGGAAASMAAFVRSRLGISILGPPPRM